MPDSFSAVAINITILGSSAYLLFIIGLLLYGFIDYYLDVYIVTNERIVDIAQDGFFRRSISELYLREVQDVSATVKGIFPTTMHYGDITIQTAGERPNFVFKNVPNPYKISKIIVDLHEAAIEGDKDNEGSKVSDSDAIKVLEEDEGSGFKIDSDAASLARKRTKDFVKGEELVETELAEEASESIEDQRSRNLIEKIDSSPKKETEASEIKKNNNDSKSDKTGTNLANSDKSSTGEMHENEEIDI